VPARAREALPRPFVRRDARREELIERILYLGGHLNLQRLDTLRIGETVVEMIELGLEFEREAIALLQRGIDVAARKSTARGRSSSRCSARRRSTPRFAAQLEGIRRVGEQNYLARYAAPEST
jgi:bacterioferritin